MQVAASTRSLWDMPFSAACGQLQDLGFDKVEIWINDDFDHLNVQQVVGDVEAAVFSFRESSRLSPVGIFLDQEVSLDDFRKIVSFAKHLKIAQLTIGASQLGTPFNSEIDRLKEFVAICNESGVRLSIRTETGHLTEDPHTAVELCQAVKGLGLSLDPSYYIAGPYRNQSWEQVYPYVFHTFLRDSSDKEVQVQLGLGEVDYAHIIKVLEREGYRRALSVDFFPSKMDLEMRPLEMRKLRLLLETHL